MISFTVLRDPTNGVIAVKGVIESVIKKEGRLEVIGYFEASLYPTGSMDYKTAKESIERLSEVTKDFFNETFHQTAGEGIYRSLKTNLFIQGMWKEVYQPNFVALITEVEVSEPKYYGLGIEAKAVEEFSEIFLEDRESTLLAIYCSGKDKESLWDSKGYKKHPNGGFFYHCCDYALGYSCTRKATT